MAKEKENKGAKQARIGYKFFLAVEAIKDARLRNGKSKDRISSEKITNMVIRHLNWNKIQEDIIESSEEEMNHYGK